MDGRCMCSRSQSYRQAVTVPFSCRIVETLPSLPPGLLHCCTSCLLCRLLPLELSPLYIHHEKEEAFVLAFFYSASSSSSRAKALAPPTTKLTFPSARTQKTRASVIFRSHSRKKRLASSFLQPHPTVKNICAKCFLLSSLAPFVERPSSPYHLQQCRVKPPTARESRLRWPST